MTRTAPKRFHEQNLGIIYGFVFQEHAKQGPRVCITTIISPTVLSRFSGRKKINLHRGMVLEIFELEDGRWSGPDESDSKKGVMRREEVFPGGHRVSTAGEICRR